MDITMDICDNLIQDKEYRDRYERIQKAEQNRIYCKHDMEHFLSVARIAYLENIERKMDIEKELIYLCALLHDMGRADEYEHKISHHKASVAFAREILLRFRVDETTVAYVTEAIAYHGKREKANKDDAWEDTSGTFDKIGSGQKKQILLAKLIARADQMSRNCFLCQAKDTCKWMDDEKTITVKR